MDFQYCQSSALTKCKVFSLRKFQVKFRDMLTLEPEDCCVPWHPHGVCATSVLATAREATLLPAEEHQVDLVISDAQYLPLRKADQPGPDPALETQKHGQTWLLWMQPSTCWANRGFSSLLVVADLVASLSPRVHAIIDLKKKQNTSAVLNIVVTLSPSSTNKTFSLEVAITGPTGSLFSHGSWERLETSQICAALRG